MVFRGSVRNSFLIINKLVVNLRPRVRLGPQVSCTLMEGVHREVAWEPCLSLSASFHCYFHLVHSLTRPRLLLVSHIYPGLPAGPVCPAHFVAAASRLRPPPCCLPLLLHHFELPDQSSPASFRTLSPDRFRSSRSTALFPPLTLLPNWHESTVGCVCHLAEFHVYSDFPRSTMTSSLLSATAREGTLVWRAQKSNFCFAPFLLFDPIVLSQTLHSWRWTDGSTRHQPSAQENKVHFLFQTEMLILFFLKAESQAMHILM